MFCASPTYLVIRLRWFLVRILLPRDLADCFSGPHWTWRNTKKYHSIEDWTHQCGCPRCTWDKMGVSLDPTSNVPSSKLNPLTTQKHSVCLFLAKTETKTGSSGHFILFLVSTQQKNGLSTDLGWKRQKIQLFFLGWWWWWWCYTFQLLSQHSTHKSPIP